MRKDWISPSLTILLSVCWYVVALVLALTICLAILSPFIEFHGAEIDIPVSFTVDARTLGLNAPSLGVTTAQIEGVRGSLKFPPGSNVSLVTPVLLLVVLTFALLLWVLTQLRDVFRTLRDGQPFAPANATRIRSIAFVVIFGELMRATAVFVSNSYAMTHFFANGLRFDARPDFNFFTIVHGLIILAIAEVFRAGTRLSEDQSLTI